VDAEEVYEGPERWLVLPRPRLVSVNVFALTLGAATFVFLYFVAHFELIAAALVTFFGSTLLRKATLDTLVRRTARA
jgi:hypothetical protein